MISIMESPSFKREIISTHILEYKRLKPKEVDQSEQQNVNNNSKEANMSIREYSRKRNHNQRNEKQNHTHKLP